MTERSHDALFPVGVLRGPSRRLRPPSLFALLAWAAFGCGHLLGSARPLDALETEPRAETRARAEVAAEATTAAPVAGGAPRQVVHAACTSAAEVASDLWDEFERMARDAQCHAGWKDDPFESCLIAGSRLAIGLSNRLVGRWNDLAGNRWARIGPRRLEEGEHDGRLVGPTERLFVQPRVSNLRVRGVSLRKRGGGAPVDLTVCATERDGSTRILWERSIEAGGGNDGMIYLPSGGELPDPGPSIVSVHLESRGPARTFAYTLGVETERRRNDLGPVDGFADLHLHQLARLAHAGLWFWGAHAGAPRNALRACTLDDHAVPRLPVPGADAASELIGLHHGRADPYGPSSWPRWDDIGHQQAYAGWLKRAHDSGLDLVVVPTVNFEPLCIMLRALHPAKNQGWGCGDMQNVRRQLDAALELDESLGWYEVAADPWDARRIIHEGKLAVVLSMEVSHPLPAQRGPYLRQLDELRARGLRTMQLAHETDSRFAGAAPHRWPFKIFELLKRAQLEGPIAPGFRIPSGDQLQLGFNTDEDGKNRRGLTSDGERLVRAMIERNMPIDVAHLSERSVRDLYRVAVDHDFYPLYDSHTRFDEIMVPSDREKQGEFVLTCEQARWIERTGGMVGLRTGDNEMRGAGTGVENTCPGSSRSFAQLVEFGADRTGLPMGFGTDLNGFISQVGPRFGDEACHKASSESERHRHARAQGSPSFDSPFNTVGLSHAGLLPGLFRDLEAIGADTRRLDRSAEAFLGMWERAFDEGRGAVSVETRCPWDVRRIAGSGDRGGTTFGQRFDEMVDAGFRLVDVEGYAFGGGTRYASVWVEGDGTAWRERRNLSGSGYGDWFREMRGRGYRPVDLDAYRRDGRIEFAGIWVENDDGLAWRSSRNLTSRAFGERFDELSDAGYRLIDVEGYGTRRGTRYADIWIENEDGVAWRERRNLSGAAYGRWFREMLNEGYRPVDIEAYHRNGRLEFAAIWIENDERLAWRSSRNLSSRAFGERFDVMRDAGYRIIDVEGYATERGARYADVWIENEAGVGWREYRNQR